MESHKVYTCIVEAAKSGKIKEPFTTDDFRKDCPNFSRGTYNAFLWKHRVENLKKRTQLFVRVSPGKFKLIRPLKYGLNE